MHDDKSRQQPPSKQVACTFDVIGLLVGRVMVVCVVNKLGVDLCGGGMVCGVCGLEGGLDTGGCDWEGAPMYNVCVGKRGEGLQKHCSPGIAGWTLVPSKLVGGMGSGRNVAVSAGAYTLLVHIFYILGQHMFTNQHYWILLGDHPIKLERYRED